jgi:hypothetical protein
MSATNRGSQRERDDFYATPAWTTDLILDKLIPGGLGKFTTVIEPACGEGAIVERLLARGIEPSKIHGIELDPDRAIICRMRGIEVTQADALSSTILPQPPSFVVTNPPFSRAIEFVKLGISVAANGGCCAMLLRLAFVESKKRRTFHRTNPAHVFVLPSRPSFCHSFKCEGSKTEPHAKVASIQPTDVSKFECSTCGRPMKLTTTDSAAYAWFVWGDSHPGKWEVL